MRGRVHRLTLKGMKQVNLDLKKAMFQVRFGGRTERQFVSEHQIEHVEESEQLE